MGIPPEVLRLTTYAFPARLADAAGSAERRSPICGSRVIVDVDLDNAGRVRAFGMRVNACAFGQAAAAILAQDLIGRSANDLEMLRTTLAAWIADEGPAPDWRDVAVIRPERLNAVRKTSVQLAFQAAADATRAAADARDRDRMQAAAE